MNILAPYDFLRNSVRNWRGFRKVSLDGVALKVLPYDKWFWDKVNVGEWERETLSILSRELHPGSRYCDIGAWVGPTVLAACHRGAEVYCFEPDPLAYERLLGNLRLNNLLHVRAFQVALAAGDWTRQMGAMVGSLGKSATSLLGGGVQHRVSVAGMSWKTACRVFDLPCFDLIKMDIEGGEVELLPEMMDYLREFRPTMILSTHWQFLSDDQRGSLAVSLHSLASIYPKVTALAETSSGGVDLADPMTASRQSSFLLQAKDGAR